MYTLKKKNKKTLIIEPGGGLGNRILALSSAFNLANSCGIKDITVLWRNNNECGCDYDDLFEKMPLPCKVKVIHFEKERYGDLIKRFEIHKVVRKLFHSMGYKLFRKLVRGIQLDVEVGKNAENGWETVRNKVLRWHAQHIYIEAYYEFYGRVSCDGIVFNKAIENKLTEFKQKNNKYVAMHIRRTDNEDAIKYSPTELFFQKAAELVGENDAIKIYVATDAPDILKKLEKQFPNNIISAILKEDALPMLSRQSSEGMRFALLEMLILANAITIYASYGSTFSIIANTIGGNEMTVLT